ncbi:MAG: phosphopantothenoylcysteine decarboxylase [Spirochaetia bacterium]|jgi:phosphopantothenoylcysteine decarboxylase/phosphopantothenate--cysteine ligase|nr:phosphopantothenoylcysteine decarboxylase [Spirochaetia bacterium]
MEKIIIGVSSSIAAYKTYELTRLFVKDGYDIHIVLTENALNLVSPLTFETLSGNPVYTQSFARERREMGHISLKENASLLLVAPATANIIGKFAGGIADDLLSTVFLSVACPVLIAPAMNPGMYSHPAVQENIAKLKKWGAAFVDPSSGVVACGDEGQGRLAEIEDIFKAAKDAVKK